MTTWNLANNETPFTLPSTLTGDANAVGKYLSSILPDLYEVDMMTDEVHVYSKAAMNDYKAAMATDEDYDPLEPCVTYWPDARL